MAIHDWRDSSLPIHLQHVTVIGVSVYPLSIFPLIADKRLSQSPRCCTKSVATEWVVCDYRKSAQIQTTNLGSGTTWSEDPPRISFPSFESWQQRIYVGGEFKVKIFHAKNEGKYLQNTQTQRHYHQRGARCRRRRRTTTTTKWSGPKGIGSDEEVEHEGREKEKRYRVIIIIINDKQQKTKKKRLRLIFCNNNNILVFIPAPSLFICSAPSPASLSSPASSSSS